MTLTIYSKPNCMQCNFTKRFLKDKGIEFIEKDITVSEEALQEVKDLGFQSVPVVKNSDGEAFAGFNPERLESLIHKA
ncbi:glutaredoxin-like protein NrdH [Atopobacter sp. AH10]|uniref:glutaredoxin-like protein NrdH n=1 Tax=Atopobacter sp. AH10 TaxID=2315861 RepID=UPI000EF24081|nr:glutaredoxin-like protein NrdH [Atopobacter sp. AH10]RLK63734.1 glutaredoxin-like protein NrdH [Atopobacter sp. AH10]